MVWVRQCFNRQKTKNPSRRGCVKQIEAKGELPRPKELQQKHKKQIWVQPEQNNFESCWSQQIIRYLTHGWKETGFPQEEFHNTDTQPWGSGAQVLAPTRTRIAHRNFLPESRLKQAVKGTIWRRPWEPPHDQGQSYQEAPLTDGLYLKSGQIRRNTSDKCDAKESISCTWLWRS